MVVQGKFNSSSSTVAHIACQLHVSSACSPSIWMLLLLWLSVGCGLWLSQLTTKRGQNELIDRSLRMNTAGALAIASSSWTFWLLQIRRDHITAGANTQPSISLVLTPIPLVLAMIATLHRTCQLQKKKQKKHYLIISYHWNVYIDNTSRGIYIALFGLAAWILGISEEACIYDTPYIYGSGANRDACCCCKLLGTQQPIAVCLLTTRSQVRRETLFNQTG